MDPSERRHRRRRTIAILGAVLLLVGIGVGVYGLLGGSSAAPTVDPRPASTGRPATASPTVSGHPPQPLPITIDPQAFARAVATALFTWQSAGEYGPADYAQPLLDVADDDESSALAADVRAYLPSAQAWAQLRQYQTRQWLTIDTAVIPKSWNTAETQAAPGQLPAGAVAYTIIGTRHRAGTWGARPVQTARSTAFTVFLTCPSQAAEPNARPCHLLRLSQLDNPLR